MEKSGLFRIVLLSLGVLSLLFLGVAFFAPGWIVFDMRMNSTIQLSESTQIGLWTISACVTMGELGGGEICKTMTMDELEQSMSASGNPATMSFMGNMKPIQGLMLCGMLAAITAFVLLVIVVRHNGSAANVTNKNKGIACAILWAIAAILVISAVGAEGHQNTNMKSSVDLVQTLVGPDGGFTMDIKFPYAILIAALGAVCSALVCVVLSIQLCKPPEGPGYWNHFANQPV